MGVNSVVVGMLGWGAAAAAADDDDDGGGGGGDDNDDDDNKNDADCFACTIASSWVASVFI